MEPADRAAEGQRDGLLRLHRRLGRGGWIESHDGFLASVCDVPVPPFNNVIVHSAFDEAEMSETLSRVAANGLPFSLQTRPAMTEAAALIADRFGMTRQPGAPLMGLTEVGTLPPVDGVTMRRLGPDEGEVHAAINAEVFEAPIDLMRALITPELVAAEGMHFVGGDVNGRTVTTALADVNGQNAWIYGVATLGAFRRRGLGAVVTAMAAQAAIDDGADQIFLQSSTMGVGVYKSIGFRQLEWWTSWRHSGPSEA